MRKHRKLLVTTACLTAPLVVLAPPSPDHEPEYQGQSLSQWLRPAPSKYPEDPGFSPEAKHAIRQIGTNAIPFLLNWISYDPPPPQTTSTEPPQQLPSPFGPSPLPESRSHAYDAEQGFSILGQIAQPAIPELTRLAVTSSSHERAHRCTRALVDIGPQALPGLLAIATDSQAKERFYAILFVPTIATNAATALPPLIKCLGDKEDEVACAAAEVLGQLAAAPSTVVPALTSALQSTNSSRRAYAARGLAGFGPAAKAAVPQLQRALKDPSQFPRCEATNALRAIAPEALTNAPAH